MSRQRDLLVNFERMRREMDELFGDVWDRTRLATRRESGFSPRVDVYYCGDDAPKAVVKAELPGVALEDVTIEVRGRQLTISGERRMSDAEGKAYQQVEIAAGSFRRDLQLSAEIDAGKASATLEDGILRVELPLRQAAAGVRQVPIERTE
jgi:HSP20 family protein